MHANPKEIAALLQAGRPRMQYLSSQVSVSERCGTGSDVQGALQEASVRTVIDNTGRRRGSRRRHISALLAFNAN